MSVKKLISFYENNCLNVKGINSDEIKETKKKECVKQKNRVFDSQGVDCLRVEREGRNMPCEKSIEMEKTKPKKHRFRRGGTVIKKKISFINK
jgi:hypothetical protein